MPVWSVAFFDERYDFEPARRSVVKAETEGAAAIIVKEQMGECERADLTLAVVRDESLYQDGYRELWDRTLAGSN